MKKHFWKKVIVAGIVAISCLMITGGSFYQALRTNQDLSSYPPPGKLYDMGGYQLHMQEMGAGPITVVLDAGMACCSLDWALVQPEIAKFAHVISYDRAGYGWSDQSPRPRTSQNIVDELHHLLQIAAIPPPFILVGHSFGGVNMRLYANQHPEMVFGIVLVDSAHEEHLQKMPTWPRTLFERWLIQPEIATFGAAIGCVRIVNYFMDVKKLIASLPQEVQDMYLAQMCTTKYVKAVAQEFSYFADSLQQIKEAPIKTENMPLSVISAGQWLLAEDRGYDKEFLDEITLAWKSLQQDLVHKSKKGKHIIADKSGHMISYQQPELITDAVREMVNDYTETHEKIRFWQRQRPL